MRKKLFYLLPSILFFIGAPIVWLVCFREVPLKISPQTTFLTEPKTKDGKSIDYFKAIRDRFEPQCELRGKPEQNGFREIVAALGKSPFFDEPDWLWPELCKKLELDPELTPTLQFEPVEMFVHREYLLWLDANDMLGKAADGQLDEDEYPSESGGLLNRLLSRPWTPEQYPFMARWIEENSPILDLIASATEKDYCFLPKIRQPGTEGTLAVGQYDDLSKQTVLPRFFLFAFWCRAQLRLGEDNLDGAWSDLIHADRLAIQLRRSFSNLNSFAPLFQQAARLIEEHHPTPEQRKRFLADLDSLPSWENRADLLQYERFNVLWGLTIVSLQNPGTMHVNWNVVARQVNESFDRLDELGKEPNPDKRLETLREWSNQASEPRRSALGRWLEKPITVNERSRELAWAHQQGLYVLAISWLSETKAHGFSELRNLLKDEPPRNESSNNEPGTASPD